MSVFRCAREKERSIIYLSATLNPTVLDDGKVLIDPKRCVFRKVLRRQSNWIHQQQLALELRKGNQRPERSSQLWVYKHTNNTLISLLTQLATSRTYQATRWPGANSRTTPSPAVARSTQTARPSGTWSRPNRSVRPHWQT